MDILKAFSIDGEQHQINVQGTIDDPLFQANQIGKLLGLANVNKTIGTFDNDEKVITRSRTPGGEQKVRQLPPSGSRAAATLNFLTELELLEDGFLYRW